MLICHNSVFSQSIYFPQNPQALSNTLDLIIQTSQQIKYPVFINISIKDASNQIYVSYHTPFFELQTNSTPIKANLFQQLYFTVGDKKKLNEPPHGKYIIEASLINYTSQQKIAQTQLSVWIDSTKSPDKKKINKPEFLIQNTNEVNLPNDTLNSYRNFNRTDISAKYTLGGIPLSTDIGITKYIFEKEVFVDNFSFSLDQNELIRQLEEKAKNARDEILSSDDTSKIKQLINKSYSNYTSIDKDWYSLLETYKSDSVQKIVRQVGQLDSNKLKASLNDLRSQSEEIENRINELQKFPSTVSDSVRKNHIDSARSIYSQSDMDSLHFRDSVKNVQKKINELTYTLNNKKNQIHTVQNQLESLYKYKDVIADKKALDSLVSKDPQKIIQSYIGEKDLYQAQLIDKKLDILKKIKKFDLGISNVTWPNQTASFLRIGGLQLSYDFGKVTLHSFAGISADQNNILSLIKRNSDKEIKAGINVEYKWKPQHIFNIYTILTKNLNGDDQMDDSISYQNASGGITYTHIFSEKLNAIFESSFSKGIKEQTDPGIQYLFSGKIRYDHRAASLVADVLYRSKDFRANNYFVSPYDNIVSNIQYSQKFLKEKINLNILNIFTRNLFPEENKYYKSTNSLNVTLNLNPAKEYFSILSGNMFYATNSIIDDINVQYTVNLLNGYNRKIHDDLQLNISKSIQYSYRVSNYIYTDSTSVLELNVLNYHEGKHINVNLNTSLLFKKNQNLLFDNNFLFIHLPDNEKTAKTKQVSNNISHNISFKKIAIETSMLYQITMEGKKTIHSYAPSVRLQGNLVKNLQVGFLYQFFKNQIFLQYGTKENNHLLRVNLAYRF